MISWGLFLDFDLSFSIEVDLDGLSCFKRERDLLCEDDVATRDVRAF